ILLFLSCYGDHLVLHSFPTRRSSDLGEVLEQPVRWVVRSNGTVEVDQNTPVWSSFGLHALKAQTDAGSARLIVERLGSREKPGVDRKSTRLNSSHVAISYAVFCLKKK